MSNYTTETWHAGAGNGEGSVFTDSDGRMRLEDGGTTLYPIANVIDFAGEGAANAQLIAAAPDLLRALRRALPWLRKAMTEGVNVGCVSPQDLGRTIEMSDAAILKATGQHG